MRAMFSKVSLTRTARLQLTNSEKEQSGTDFLRLAYSRSQNRYMAFKFNIFSPGICPGYFSVFKLADVISYPVIEGTHI